jgi:hypothetical protein
VLKGSDLPVLKEWLGVPYVGLRARVLLSDELSDQVVAAAQASLKGEHASEAGVSGALADSMAAAMLVKGLSLRDALDAFLEARSSCVRGICEQLGRSGSSVGHPEGQDAATQVHLDLMRRACSVVALSAVAALDLFSRTPDGGEGGEEGGGGEAALVRQLRALTTLHVRGDMVRRSGHGCGCGCGCDCG